MNFFKDSIRKGYGRGIEETSNSIIEFFMNDPKPEQREAAVSWNV